MGMLYTFTCAHCGYSTEASGGADSGMTFDVQTVLCRNCGELHDAVVREQKGRKRARKVELRCPKSAAHEVVAWEQGGPCPRCGTPMPPGAPYALFD